MRSNTKANKKHHEEAFKEFDEVMVHKREQTVPDDDVIERELLTADHEDKSKGFAQKKIERACSKLSTNYLNAVNMDADISPKVKIKQGAMMVVWHDITGTIQTHDVVEVSMNHVKFYSRSSQPTRIKQIIFPLSESHLDIVRSEAVVIDKEFAVFKLLEFANNSEDWMTWIEKLTRINEES